MINLEKRKVFFVIVGPSGSGKDSVIANRFKELGIPETVSTTTREKREGEIDGLDYHYIDQIFESDMVEYAEYGGNYYGLSKKEVNKMFDNYDMFFAITEIQGLKNLKKLYNGEIVSIYIDVPGKTISDKVNTIRTRMKCRGDSEEVINERINLFINKEEYSNDKYCDYIISHKSKSVIEEKLNEIIINEKNSS